MAGPASGLFRSTALPLSRSVSRLDIYGAIPIDEEDEDVVPELGEMPRTKSVPSKMTRTASSQFLDFPAPSDRVKCGFWPELSENFGSQLLALLFVSQHLIKGAANALSYTAKPFLYRSYGVSAPVAQVYNSILLTPLMLRPVIGLASDVLPVCGYNKAPYIFITAALGAGASCVLGITDVETLEMQQVVVCLFFVFLEIAVVDLLTEAKYAENVRQKPAYGPTITAYVWGGLELFTFFGVLLCGSLVQVAGPRMVYLVAFPLLASIFVPVSMGYLQEKEQHDVDIARVKLRLQDQYEIPCLCFVMLAGAILIFILGMTGASVMVNFIASLGVAFVVLLGSALLLSPEVAKFTIFILVFQSLSIRIRGAAFYFYTDNHIQYPNGPHFSDFFFSSVMGCCAAICSLFAVFTYLRYLADWRSRRVVLLMGIFGGSLHLLDALQFSRWNVHWGIPDHLFIIGATSLETATSMWMWMPLMVAFAHECPKGIEATMFALLSGCKYLGGIVCDAGGAVLLDLLEIRPSGADDEGDQFLNMGVAATVCAILPLMAIVPLSYLIPDTPQDEGPSSTPAQHQHNDGTYGSVWRTCGSSASMSQGSPKMQS